MKTAVICRTCEFVGKVTLRKRLKAWVIRHSKRKQKDDIRKEGPTRGVTFWMFVWFKQKVTDWGTAVTGVQCPNCKNHSLKRMHYTEPVSL